MAGIQDFTYLNYGKETVRGTPVAPTRKWYGEATGVADEDLGLNFHENENRGRRSLIARVTQTTEDASIKVRSGDSGIGWDDWVWPLTQLKGGMTGTGAGADKTWAAAPAMTGLNNPEAFSIDVGDDIQNWRHQYAMFSRWKQSSVLGDVTRFEGDLFAQRAVKTAKATPADNTTTRIPGGLWTVKFAATFAGLTGAAIQTNLLIDHELEVFTGLVWRHYQDGNLYGSQHVETAISGSLKLTVESTAFTISEFYDKWKAQTVDYVRLRAQGPVLGGSFYSLQHDMPILWSKVPKISKADGKINLYEVEANLLDDGTNPPISPTLVCSLTAIP